MNKEAGEMLKKARERKVWTQDEAAERLAKSLNQTYSKRQYQKLEDGEFPKHKKIIVQQLDKILGTNLSEVIYEQIVPKGNGVAGNVSSDPLIHRTSSEWKAIRFLIQEIAVLRSQRENRSYQDCLDELNNAVALLTGTH